MAGIARMYDEVTSSLQSRWLPLRVFTMPTTTTSSELGGKSSKAPGLSQTGMEFLSGFELESSPTACTDDYADVLPTAG